MAKKKIITPAEQFEEPRHREASGYYYQVGESRILVRNRPVSLEIGAKALEEVDKADAYLSVTDTFCTPPSDRPFVWYPWNEDWGPKLEMYYAVNRALIWWVHYQKLKNIQIFCDGGTHRSVTVFGAFLLTYFPKDAEEIVNSRVGVSERDNPEDGHCHPLGYIRSYLDAHPEDWLLLKAMGQDYLGRFDNHCSGIAKICENRYGRNIFK